MTPQIPGYVLSFELIVRPVVTIIALGLIWLGAARMPASAKSRYATAGVLSAVLIGWLAVAQYLGAANTYFATTDTRGADHIVRFADPARRRRHRPVAVGKRRKAGLRDPAALARGGSGLSRRGRHIPRALGRRTPALAIRAAGGNRRRCDGQSLPSSWPRGWHETQLARAGQHTPGAFSESPTSSWQSRWGR